jgi:cobalt-precorrin-5B (C1)-methyltransferase
MLKDPVTEFTYPSAWVEKCADQAILEEVRSGRAVLTADGKALRRGYTTGTTASAAAKAAVLSLFGPVEKVEVTTNCGVRVEVAVRAENGRAECRKYPGDYPGDMTANACFISEVELRSGQIVIDAGKGIGRFVRDTPHHRTGEPAISIAARGSILRSVAEALETIGEEGALVRLSIMEGTEIGPWTLNPRMGVEGGISVLGTTGLVEPWDDHLEESNLERIAGAEKVVLTTGRTGLRYARLLFPDHEAVLVGARMARAIDAAERDVVLCGLPALILKFIDPDILKRTGANTIEELSSSDRWPRALQEALARSKRERPQLRVVLVARDGTILGDNR